MKLSRLLSIATLLGISYVLSAAALAADFAITGTTRHLGDDHIPKLFVYSVGHHFIWETRYDGETDRWIKHGYIALRERNSDCEEACCIREMADSHGVDDNFAESLCDTIQNAGNMLTVCENQCDSHRAIRTDVAPATASAGLYNVYFVDITDHNIKYVTRRDLESYPYTPPHPDPDLNAHIWDNDTAIWTDMPAGSEGSYSQTRHAPSVVLHQWDHIYDPNLVQTWEPTVVFTGNNGRIYFQAKVGPTYPPHSIESEWYWARPLPDPVLTDRGPSATGFNGRLVVAYKGRGEDQAGYQIYAARRISNYLSRDEVSIVRVPNAYSDESPSLASYQGTLIVAYTGHNNDHIWLRRYRPETGGVVDPDHWADPANWDSLGHIRNVASAEIPALLYLGYGGPLYLAFKGLHDDEICVGVLDIDDDVSGPDAAGHTWTSIRNDHPDLNCGP